MFRFVLGIPVIGVVISLLLNVILSVLLVLTYTNLTKEGLVASVYFDAVPQKQKEYIAHLYDAENSKIGDFIIYGDQWRIDAKFIKMKYWAAVLGAESKYTLDRIEGRYEDVQEANTLQKIAHQIESSSLIDNFSFFMDIAYGSSVYKEIALNTKYKVLKSTTGLLVREEKINEKKSKGFIDGVKGWLGK